MQIKINKDLEEEFRDELIQGFSIREALYILSSIALIGCGTAIAYFQFGLFPDTGIFLGMPLGIPVLFFGFYRFQGMTLMEYLKEIFYAKQTQLLTYDADELPKNSQTFTMHRKKKRRLPWEWAKKIYQKK